MEYYLYTDGSTFNNGYPHAVGGIGVLLMNIVDGNKLYKQKIGCPYTLGIPTNQKTEIYALIRGLELFLKTVLDNYNKSELYKIKLYIYLDSQYLVNIITKWVDGWKKNNWVSSKNDEVKNKDLIMQIDHQINILKKYGIQYEIKHINSHQNEPQKEENDLKSLWWQWKGNMEVDELAVLYSKKLSQL